MCYYNYRNGTWSVLKENTCDACCFFFFFSCLICLYFNALAILFWVRCYSIPCFVTERRKWELTLKCLLNFAEAKQEFNGNCSVQVYSVQACIPKDPAALWNAEFVQAEELFKQPSMADNCLRDNRYVVSVICEVVLYLRFLPFLTFQVLS